ncbi:MAG: choline-sulfatase [Planctomycetota bacterium]|jgi:choline-sulfatase
MNIWRSYARKIYGTLLAGSVTVIAGCSSDSEESAAPVAQDLPLSGVLITLDTTNLGALDIYGKDRGLTPNLKSLAQGGVVYETAHTVAPLTLPAHVSMMTGLYPIRHGVRENGIMRLSTEAETLAERAAEAGFETAAFISSSVLLKHYGLDQGFEIYDEPSQESVNGGQKMTERNAAQVTDAALAWLAKRDTERPFFLWVHYFDPHIPYAPPIEFAEKAGGNLYRGEVSSMDHELGRLLDGLSSQVGYDKLTIGVAADHGEGFQSHGEPTHSLYCYEATTHVPFLMRFADGRRAGTRSDEVVSVVDLFPTFLDELGLGTPKGIDGLSLAGATLPAERGVYMEAYSGYLSYGWSPLAGWFDKGGKYLHSSVPEFYDVSKDRVEANNLMKGSNFDVEKYRAAIANLSKLPRLSPGGDVDLSAVQVRELNALGYAAAGIDVGELPDPLAPSSRPAPATQAGIYAKSNFARGLAQQGNSEEAIRLLGEVVRENPLDFNAVESLGSLLVRVELYEDAIKLLDEAVANGGDRYSMHVYLGFAHESLGQLKLSLVEYRRADLIQPGNRGVTASISRVESALAKE